MTTQTTPKLGLGSRVALQDLTDLGACWDQLELFEREFGSSTRLTVENGMRFHRAGGLPMWIAALMLDERDIEDFMLFTLQQSMAALLKVPTGLSDEERQTLERLRFTTPEEREIAFPYLVNQLSTKNSTSVPGEVQVSQWAWAMADTLDEMFKHTLNYEDARNAAFGVCDAAWESREHVEAIVREQLEWVEARLRLRASEG